MNYSTLDHSAIDYTNDIYTKKYFIQFNIINNNNKDINLINYTPLCRHSCTTNINTISSI